MSKLIRTRYMTPRVLSYKSRDYQYLSLLVDLVANSMKLDTDYFTDCINPLKCKSSILRSLGSLVGYDYDEELTPYQNRILISNYYMLNRLRGTTLGYDLAIYVYSKMVNQFDLGLIPTVYSENQVMLIRLTGGSDIDYKVLGKLLKIVRPVGVTEIISKSLPTYNHESSLSAAQDTSMLNMDASKRKDIKDGGIPYQTITTDSIEEYNSNVGTQDDGTLNRVGHNTLGSIINGGN